MKELAITPRCDDCGERATHERKVSVDGGPVKVLDLCDIHDLDWLLLLMENAPGEERMTQRLVPRLPPGLPKEVRLDASIAEVYRTCPICDGVQKNRQTLSTHLNIKHGVRLRDVTDWRTPRTLDPTTQV